MSFQMMRVISSPSISTTGFFTLILAMSLDALCREYGRENSGAMARARASYHRPSVKKSGLFG
jgi:hypothetical protein